MIKWLQTLFGTEKKYQLRDVFTPSSAAQLTYVDRPDLDEQIAKALDIKGHQIIIYGHTGSGKTTFIENLLKNGKRRYITTNCMSETTFNNLVIDAFDQLNPFYTNEMENKESSSISSELKATYLTIDATLKGESSEEHTEKYSRALPLQLTPQRLTDFLGATNTIWVIDDFHKVMLEERTKFSQMLKVFVDTANKHSNIKVIAIGAVGTARDVVNYDRELNTRIAEIYVPLLNNEELDSIITKGEKYLNIEFSQDLKKGITTYSSSLAAVCHHLCNNICFENDVKETLHKKKQFGKDSLENAIKNYVNSNSDTHKKTLDKVFKEDSEGNFKKVLKVICNELSKEELNIKEITQLLSRKNIAFKKDRLSEILNSLTTVEFGEIMRFDENSGKFSFSNPFFKAYTKMCFDNDNSKIESSDEFISITVRQLFEMIEREKIQREKFEMAEKEKTQREKMVRK